MLLEVKLYRYLNPRGALILLFVATLDVYARDHPRVSCHGSRASNATATSGQIFKQRPYFQRQSVTTLLYRSCYFS